MFVIAEIEDVGPAIRGIVSKRISDGGLTEPIDVIFGEPNWKKMIREAGEAKKGKK